MSSEQILIVEDEVIAAMSLEKKITDFGFRSAGIAGGVREAVRMANEMKPDLILMDIKLNGGGDGVAAANEIQATRDIPVVFVTAYSDEATLRRALKSAPFGFLTKPYRDEAIKSTIEVALNKFRIEKRLRESERDLRSVFELAPVGALQVSADGRVRAANQACAGLFGFENAGELTGVRFESLFAGDSVALARERLAILHQGELPPVGDFWSTVKSGRTVCVRVRSSLIHAAETGEAISLHFLVDFTAEREKEALFSGRIEALEESNQRLEQFASLASHDLTAPARNAGLYIGLLARESAAQLDDRGRELLSHALSESKKMQELVSDLLEYCRASHRPSEMKSVSLLKVLGDVLAILRPQIEERRADISYGYLPQIWGNEVQLRRLFANLIENSLVYCRRKPKIRIAARELDNEIEVSLRDNGLGVTDEERDKIFEVFQRGSASEGLPGSGIGLASCKKIVDIHGGKIWVAPNVRDGAEFHFTIPLQATSPRDGNS